MPARQDGVVRRALRRFTLGSGPLKRGSDRLQLVARLVVVLSVLLAPIVAVATAGAVTTHLQAVADDQAAERSHVRAVLLEDAAEPSRGPDYTEVSTLTVPVRAGWPVPGGGSQEGLVMARAGTPAGSPVPVWVDRTGALVPPPLDPAGIPRSAVAVGALPLIGLPVVTWLLYALCCFVLDTYRDRRWGRDWAAVEPVWNTRLS
ncbi:Rv1733c family protein [Petropleomorpha daqingensis]|uniref:Transmembrane protein n=1 Tax=Petropleomorpha daqingensis TaxID=2026353 RepID=A0A853CJ20_9ACTN|nr:hypothetical protein [Petropleomorpha daqingensis]NYJ07537.1 hypothetical protein [Petropleomorpha daqingensis]